MAGTAHEVESLQNLQWTEEELRKERDALTNVQPTNFFPLNILLFGATGAGKSSFINTVFAALTGKIEDVVFTAKGDKSITTSLWSYSLQDKCPVVLFDTPGFEYSDNKQAGICARDVEYILDGHIKVGYTFQDEPIALDSQYFNPKPEDKEKIHVVVLVVDSTSISCSEHHILSPLKGVFTEANKREIRWAVVMTHVDTACKDVKDDLKTISTSKTINEIVPKVNEKFGVKSSNVFPIQNYVSQTELSLPMNILALRTLIGITHLGALTLKSQAKFQLLVSPWRNEKNLTKQAVCEMRAHLIETLQKNVINFRLCYMGPSGVASPTS